MSNPQPNLICCGEHHFRKRGSLEPFRCLFPHQFPTPASVGQHHLRTMMTRESLEKVQRPFGRMHVSAPPSSSVQRGHGLVRQRCVHVRARVKDFSQKTDGHGPFSSRNQPISSCKSGSEFAVGAAAQAFCPRASRSQVVAVQNMFTICFD